MNVFIKPCLDNPHPHQLTSVCHKNIIIVKVFQDWKSFDTRLYLTSTQNINQRDGCLWKRASVQPNCHCSMSGISLWLCYQSQYGSHPISLSHTHTPRDFRTGKSPQTVQPLNLQRKQLNQKGQIIRPRPKADQQRRLRMDSGRWCSQHNNLTTRHVFTLNDIFGLDHFAYSPNLSRNDFS